MMSNGQPWLSKGCSRFKSKVENDSPISCCKRAVSLPFLDNINPQLQDRLRDKNHIGVFVLLSSVISSNNCNIDETPELLFHGYKNETY